MKFTLACFDGEVRFRTEVAADCDRPSNIELELSIYDKGEYHALAFPVRRDGSGWRDVRANRLMPLKPTHWRRWDHGRE
jgi:hypothetical protein